MLTRLEIPFSPTPRSSFMLKSSNTIQVSSLMEAQQNKFGAILASLLASDGARGLLRGYW